MTISELVTTTDNEGPPSSLTYVKDLVELILGQADHRARTWTNPNGESPRVSFQSQINALAAQALTTLRRAKPEEMQEIQEYLGGQDPQVERRVYAELKNARVRAAQRRIPRSRTPTVPRS